MKNATRMDIRQMVTEMEVRSDEIVQELVITDDAVEALKKIKKTIARTHTLVDAMSEEMQEQYSPVLTRILSYVQQAVSYPEAVELYAERICDHVDNYLLLHRHYDAEYEQGKDRETASFIEIKRAALRIEEITQAKNMLIEQKIQGAYPTGSADYQIMVARFDHLEVQLKNETFRLNQLRDVAEANGLIRRELERAITLADMAALRTMTLEDFTEVSYENQKQEAVERDILSSFKAIAAEVESPTSVRDTYDMNFRKAVEETLLERLYQKSEADFEREIAEIPKETLWESFLEVSQKLGRVEEQMLASEDQQKKDVQELRDILNDVVTRTQDLMAFRADMSGDIQKEVEYCLMRTPMDVQSANLKIRNCIELYIRYVKGVDMNDRFMFKPGETVVNKMAFAGVKDHFNELVGIYSSTNEYIHNGFKVIGIKADRNMADKLRENAAKLKQWGIDRYDPIAGLPFFYSNQDRLLKKMLDENKLDRRRFEDKNDYPINTYFQRMKMLQDQMQGLGITPPTMMFTCLEDVRKYLNPVKEEAEAPNGVVQPSPAPESSMSLSAEPAALTAPKPSAPSDTTNRKQGKITSYIPKSKFGYIDEDRFFLVKDIRTNGGVEKCLVGATVSYVPDTNKDPRHLGKPVAIDIDIISPPEKVR